MNDNDERIVIRGEIHVSLSTVARCYAVEVTWIEEAYELGLLGVGELSGGSVLISVTQMDRIAQIVRLHFQQGVSLPGVWMLLYPTITNPPVP
jgi:hypothetical protein